jgi:leucyl-tRNA synthetase
MAKSKGNVVDPNDLIEHFGTDTTRLFLLFAAPPERDLEWSDQGVAGCHRFLNRVWSLVNSLLPDIQGVPAYRGGGEELFPDLWDLRHKLHKTIAKVTADIEGDFHFNTAIAAVMELVNAFYPARDSLPREEVTKAVFREGVETMLKLLNPMVPHLAAELWERLGYQTSLQQEAWPEAQPEALVEPFFELVVQVNGKVRSRIKVHTSGSQAVMEQEALGEVRKWLADKAPKKIVWARNRKLVNIVV